jgi:Spirocyclase AveC-like
VASTRIGPEVTQRPVAAPRRSFNAVCALAVLGAIDVAYALWTWGAWLLDGPEPITAFRDTHSATLWVARGYELAMVCAALTILFVVVRGCIRQRRMTYDACIVIAGFFTLFWDPMVNWMQPNFFYSSQWINVNTWTGYAPFVVNPTASQMPQPIVFIGLIYPFGLLAFAMVLNAGMAAVRRYWPNVSSARLVAVTYIGALVVCLALEAPMFLMNLWGLPGAPSEFALFDNDHRFAWAEYITTTIVFTTIASVRFFKNDKGQTIAERNLEGLTTGGRALVSTLATIALFAMSMWVLLLIQLPAGLHASPYPEGYPTHMINNLCDVQPGMHTEYGPCPGSPGFRMPVRQTFDPAQHDRGR